MPITIPFGPAAASAGAATAVGGGPTIAIPLRLLPSVTGAASLRGQSAAELNAVTAAVAEQDPRAVLTLARLVRERPEDAIEPIDDAEVKEVLAAVRAARDDPARVFDVPESTRAVAAAVGASPRLAAAARLAIGDSLAARFWVVYLVVPDVLERAARAALRAKGLVLLDTDLAAKSLQKEVTELKGKVDEIGERLEGVKATVDEWKGAAGKREK